MKESEKAFYLFYDWIDDLDHLDGADAWRIVKAISEYHRNGTCPLDLVDGPLRSIVSILFHQIKRKEAVSEIRRQAVNTRYNKAQNFVVQKPTKYNNELQLATTEYSIQNTVYNTPPLQGESKARTCAHTPPPAHARENTTAYGTFGNVYLTEDEQGDLKERFGDVGAGELIDKLSRKIKAKGYQYDDHYAAILLWAVQDGVKRRPDGTDTTEKSYEIKDFYEAALARSYAELSKEETHG